MQVLRKGDQELIRLIGPLVRYRYLIVIAAAFGSSLQHLRGTGEDWHFFVVGSELLFGHHRPGYAASGGLHLYANYPDYQIGPLSFLVATPFRALGETSGRIAAGLIMTALAPGLVFVLERTARIVWKPLDERAATLVGVTALFGGVALAEAWSPLSVIYAHLDDVLVLTAAIATLWAVARRRPGLAGCAIGIAIAAKPWGIVALPLVFSLPGRGRRIALLAAAGISVVAWAPFVLADRATLSAVRPAVETSPASVLHLFGVPVGSTPSWVRLVQLAGALLAEAVALARRRWGAVLLVGIAVRIGLDPQVFLYYSAGLVVAALAWDLLRHPHPLPWWTLATFVLLNDAYVAVQSPHARGVMRLLITIGVVGTAVLLPAPAATHLTEQD